MKKLNGVDFTDENIQTLFGFEDAESESIARLKEYYLKRDTYGRVVADLPIRILVGHKGTGKSALFKVAISEEKEKGHLPILVKPDDIAELGKSDENFLLRIRQWKWGLNKIIGEKVFNELGLFNDEVASKITKFGVKLTSLIFETVKSVKDKVTLLPAQKLLMENYLTTNKITVYIDDLDRGWEGKRDDIIRISALLNCIRDLANENERLFFKISLRSDVYFLVRTSDESTDKIESSVVWFSWTNHEILVMLIKRILTFVGESFDESILLNSEQKDISYHLNCIMEPIFSGSGKWANVPIYKVLMSLIRKRPRDLVKLCTLASRNAKLNKSQLIRTSDFKSIFEEYSQGRIQDTINEFKSELNNIEHLIFGMKPSKKTTKYADGFVFTTADLYQKISNIMEQNTFVFANGKAVDKKNLAQFLYKINFLTARKQVDGGVIDRKYIDRKYFEENRYLSSSFADFGYDWEIHPAFRWALKPDSLDDIFNKLLLSSD